MCLVTLCHSQRQCEPCSKQEVPIGLGVWGHPCVVTISSYIPDTGTSRWQDKTFDSIDSSSPEP